MGTLRQRPRAGSSAARSGSDSSRSILPPAIPAVATLRACSTVLSLDGDISYERWDMRKSRKLRKPLTLTKETLRQLVPPPAMRNAQGGFAAEAKIGRASCRERV